MSSDDRFTIGFCTLMVVFTFIFVMIIAFTLKDHNNEETRFFTLVEREMHRWNADKKAPSPETPPTAVLTPSTPLTYECLRPVPASPVRGSQRPSSLALTCQIKE